MKLGSEKNSFSMESKLLVERCEKGNRQSQRELFNQYKSSVYSIIGNTLGPKFDFDDIVQQVFIKIFRSLKNFKGLSSLDTWIYRITVKVCIDQLRKKYRKRQIKTVSDSDALEFYKDESIKDPLDEKAENELKEEIYRALDRLNREKRLVVTMFEMEGFSLQEISNILNKPVGTVKSRLFHGRKELAKYLRKYVET